MLSTVNSSAAVILAKEVVKYINELGRGLAGVGLKFNKCLLFNRRANDAAIHLILYLYIVSALI